VKVSVCAKRFALASEPSASTSYFVPIAS
jgi:hypothetical protein